MQLGKAFTILAQAQVREEIMHDDVAAFHAPSECHALVSKGEARRLREARRRAKAVSGLSRSHFNRTVMGALRRGQHGPNWYHRLCQQLHLRHNPYC